MVQIFIGEPSLLGLRCRNRWVLVQSKETLRDASESRIPQPDKVGEMQEKNGVKGASWCRVFQRPTDLCSTHLLFAFLFSGVPLNPAQLLPCLTMAIETSSGMLSKFIGTWITTFGWSV